MKVILTLIILTTTSLLLSCADSLNEEKRDFNQVFVERNPNLENALEVFRQSYPEARVLISERTGEINWIDNINLMDPLNSRPLYGINDVNSELAHESSLIQRKAVLIDFLHQHSPTLFQIYHPLEQFQIPQTEDDDGKIIYLHQEREELAHAHYKNKKTYLGQSLVLKQSYRGIEIEGNHVIGHFDQFNNLYALSARIFPPQFQNERDQFPPFEDEATRESIIRGELKSLADKKFDLAWVNWCSSDEDFLTTRYIYRRSQERFLRSPLRLLIRVEYACSYGEVIAYYDPYNYQWVEALNNVKTINEWHQVGNYREDLRFEDERNNTSDERTFSSYHQQKLRLGFGQNVADHIFSHDQYFVVRDCSDERAFHWRPVNNQCPDLILESETFSSREWQNAIDNDQLNTIQKGAFHLANNINVALEWWHGMGLRSWDGRGTKLIGSVGSNRNQDFDEQGELIPQLNAFGGRGLVMVGDAPDPRTGYFLGSSLEIVNHEIMHSVLEATTSYIYRGESGAIEESMADFFGKAITAENDRYIGNVIAGDGRARTPQRNVVTPQIPRYSEFFQDPNNRGMHRNSGILNRANYLITHGGEMRGIITQGTGVSWLANFYLAFHRLVSLSEDTTLEEFAVKAHGFCVLTSLISQSLGSEGILEKCRLLEMAYKEVEIFPGHRDGNISLERVVLNDNQIEFHIHNQSTVGLPFSHLNYQARPFNQMDQSLPFFQMNFNHHVAINYQNDEEQYQTEAGATLAPGSRASISFPINRLPPEISALARRSKVRIQWEVSPNENSQIEDDNLRDNRFVTSLVSNYFVSNFITQPTQQGNRLFVYTNVSNLNYHGIPDGLQGHMVYRMAGANNNFNYLQNTYQAKEMIDDGDTRNNSAILPRYTVEVNFMDEFPEVVIEDAQQVIGRPGFYKTTLNSSGRITGHEQAPLLLAVINSSAQFQESRYNDNIVCLNCRAVQDTRVRPTGVILQLTRGINFQEIFPRELAPLIQKASPPPSQWENALQNTLQIRRVPLRYHVEWRPQIRR